jgi:hypothetical protein
MKHGQDYLEKQYYITMCTCAIARFSILIGFFYSLIVIDKHRLGIEQVTDDDLREGFAKGKQYEQEHIPEL